MFGGLGSLDLNSTFAQLTNLSLDNLQKDDGVDTKVSSSQKSAAEVALKDQRDDFLLTIKVKDDQINLLHGRIEEVEHLRELLEEDLRLLEEACAGLHADRSQSQMLFDDLQRKSPDIKIARIASHVSCFCRESEKEIEEVRRLAKEASESRRLPSKAKRLKTPSSKAAEVLKDETKSSGSKVSAEELERLETRLAELEQLRRDFEAKLRIQTESMETKDRDIVALKQVLATTESLLQDARIESVVMNQEISTLKACLQGEQESHLLDMKENEAKTKEALEEVKQHEASRLELEGKVAGLTEKLRELMQKYADVKARSVKAESLLETQRSEFERSMSDKAQLRLDSVEQQASDAKVRVSELLDKYGEAQRVIAELKASIQKINDEHSGCEAKQLTLKQNCNDAERNFSDLLGKYEDAQRAFTDLEARFREINQEHTDCEEKRTALELRYNGTKTLLDDCQARLQMLEEQNKQLEAQVEALQSRTRAEVDVALNLESYKKRAQLALQKANTNVAHLTEEKHALLEERDKMQLLLSSSQENYVALEREKSDLLALYDAARLHTQALETEVCDQRKEIFRLEEELAAQRAQQAILSSVAVPTNYVPPSPSPHSSKHFEERAENGREPSDVSVEHSEGHEERFMLVDELQQQLSLLKKELALRAVDLETLHQQILFEREEKGKLKQEKEEILAFVERLKKVHNPSESIVNGEYLKNCVFKFMSSTESSERKRLYPVIGTILNFTPRERSAVEEAMVRWESEDSALTELGSSIESWFGINPSSIFGGKQS
eukprot:scaffold1365_cov163-Ochromonas_danica.AAC.19